MKKNATVITIFIMMFLVIGIGITLVKLAHIKVEKQEEDFSYEAISKNLYSDIEQSGYRVDGKYVTIYLGKVSGVSNIDINTVIKEKDNYLINVETINQGDVTKYQTPSITVKLDNVPGTIKVNDITNNNEINVLDLREINNKKDSETPTKDNNKTETIKKEEVKKTEKVKVETKKEDASKVVCSPGYYYDKDNKRCIVCPVNTYSKKGDNKCTACPVDKCSPSGSKSESSCKPCASLLPDPNKPVME